MSKLIQKEQQATCKVQNESKLNNVSGGWMGGGTNVRCERFRGLQNYAIDDGGETERGFESEKKENQET